MKKYSLEAQELLSQSELFEVKAGEKLPMDKVGNSMNGCDQCERTCVTSAIIIIPPSSSM